MSITDAYFQFPLKLLATAKSPQQLVQDACTWTLLHYGRSFDQDAAKAIAAAGFNGDYDDDDTDAVAIVAAAVRLGVNVPHIESTMTEAHRLESRHGEGGQLVRLRTDIAWSAHDDDWPLLKIKVLCGVYSGIGDRHMVKMNHRLLRAICSGYSSPKGLKASQLIPQTTMRYWLEQLWMKNFFQFCLHKRERWYSLTCKSDLVLATKVKAQSQLTTAKKVISTDDV